MLFEFAPRSSLLLPFVVPGAVATGWLLGRAGWRGHPADALLALLIALPTLSVTQWMLGYAGWYDSHNGYTTAMFYVPWQWGLALGPAWYLYFRSLTNQEFRWRPALVHLLPGLAQAGLFAGAAVYDLGWWRGVRGQALPDHFGTKGPASGWLDHLQPPLEVLGYALLLGYGLLMLADYRRYRRYLDDNFSDPERLRFAGLRQLLLLQLLGLGLALTSAALDAAFGSLSYDEAWNAFALRGVLIYGLIMVGVQANYAAVTSPLRFGEPPATTGWETAAAPAGPATAAPEAPTAPAVLPDLTGTAPADEMPAAPAEPAPPGSLPPELLTLRDRLLALMADEQPWLEPELTLAELAHRLRTSPALLSRTINTGCGQNFNDFVNGYRVAEARRKLADPRFAHYSLVGVALESGFNSKSTFNRVFKKLDGRVPGDVTRPKS